MKLLLEREDLDPDSPDGGGRAPLPFAAERSRGGVLELFLERRNVGPNSSDNNGRTPLSFAAEREWGGIVKLLLERRILIPIRRKGKVEYPIVCYLRKT